MMKSLKKYNILPLMIIFFLVLSEALICLQIWNLNMLPAKYFVLVICVLALLDLLTAALMFRRKAGLKHNVSRVLGYFLSVLIALGMLAGSQAIVKIQQTVSAVTKTAQVSAVVEAYVLTDDPAENIEDASEYSFAVTEAFDWDNTRSALEALELQLETEVSAINYPSVFDMVDALFAGEADGILLNSGYIDILEDMDTYAEFSERTKSIWEYGISSEVQEAEDAKKQEKIFSGDSQIEPFVVYISGSDTRSKVLKSSRSDVNILAVINPQTKQILLVNTPRDYYIGNPAGNDALDKLTHCGIYGVECSMKALEKLYEEEIEYYGQINFTGFQTLIDAIGGITVYSDTAFTTLYGKYKIQAGENHLTGAQALGFARERYSLKGGDNDRGKNQMKVITAVINQISAGNIVSNYSDILDSLQGMFATNISESQISRLVKMQLSDMPDWDVRSYAVTGRGGSASTYSMPGVNAYVMHPNQDTVKLATELIDRVMAGEILSEEDLKK